MNDIDKSGISMELKRTVDVLKGINPHVSQTGSISFDNSRKHLLQKVLIANRGEIAKRFFLSLHEEGIPSVAVVTDPDKGQSWYDFADEVVFIGDYKNYSNPFVIASAAMFINANAVYSGYGFLSENPEFVRIIELLNSSGMHRIIFMGPDYRAMSMMGDKISARGIASEYGIPLFKSSDLIKSFDIKTIRDEAEKIGLPVILKPASGGGGKGMVTVNSADEIEMAAEYCMRAGLSLYNDSTFYIEKLILKPIHIEVQIFNGWVIGVRKCAVQRRNQKIIEESGELFIDDSMYDLMVSISERIAGLAGYANNCGAGTIEFLIDQDTGEIGFLEMNTRLQVEYAVTDQSLDIDLVKSQIQLFDGRVSELGHLSDLKRRAGERNHAIECRIYAEEPENSYIPSPGVITELDLPTFNGIRCDFGFKEGDRVLPMYDPMIGKLIVHGRTRGEALIRLERALQEIYIRGVRTNIPQLLRIIRHPLFAEGHYNNNFLSEYNDLNPANVSGDQSSGYSPVNIILGAFAEYLRIHNSTVSVFNTVARLEGILNVPLPDFTSDFIVEYQGQSHSVRFLQVSNNAFLSFLDQRVKGLITLSFSNETADNIIVNYEHHLLRLRVDRRSDSLSVRMKDQNNKINYYSMKIQPAGEVEKSNISLIRSPFQGTIISFYRDFKIGDTVIKGEPLVILSSMKMETVIKAASDGKIIYAINTVKSPGSGSEGGKPVLSIQEGETLFRIAEFSGKGKSSETDQREFIGYFDSEDRSLLTDPVYYYPVIGRLFSALLFGFVRYGYVIEMMQRIASKIDIEIFRNSTDDQLKDRIESSIMHYVYIKKMFSTSVTAGGISYYDELRMLVENRNRKDSELSSGFMDLFRDIAQSYGLPDDIDVYIKSGDTHFDRILLYMRLSYEFISDHQEFIRYLINILSYVNISAERINFIINQFDRYGEREKDDILVESLKRVLNKKILPDSSRLSGIDSIGCGLKYSFDVKGVTDEDSIISFIRRSADQPAEMLIPDYVNGKLRAEIEHRLNILKRSYNVQRINSLFDDLLVYSIRPLNGVQTDFIAFPLLNEGQLNNADLSGILDNTVNKSVTSLLICRKSLNGGACLVHLILAESVIDFETSRADFMNYQLIRESAASALDRFNDCYDLRCMIDSEIKPLNSNNIARRLILFYKYMGRTVFEFLSDNDRRNIYSSADGADSSDQRLFNIRKWPVELWAKECFDSDDFCELKIDTLDYQYQGDEKTENSVGARIYAGRIHGRDACFFMKDSRINSGSTGNLEGLKYAAASYISYLKGWTLYVWNDGAGANIKEGLVGLNRGAEGFMMNTLQTSNNHEKFKRFVENNPDPVLKSLFNAIDIQYSLSIDNMMVGDRALSLVAVGVGSSAGLDVYGSSQAVIQIMLDSDQSYRVLTGSNVIRSIIGEDISNYEIGGARMICNYAGIADLMVTDKIHLVQTIRDIHRFFSRVETPGPIRRTVNDCSTIVDRDDDIRVCTEELIRSNVDDGEFIEFRKEYYESDSLIAGFACIGGIRTFIMSARTDSGLINNASVLKARELLRISNRIGSNSILILGREYIQHGNLEDSSLVSRNDFIDTLRSRSGLRIHIITHEDGLKLYYINNTADVIIFIEKKLNGRKRSRLALKNSTFIANSMHQAFDLSCRVAHLLSSSCNYHRQVAGGIPSVPSDPSIPFDMFASVIEPVFDEGSFLEFYSEMNDPDAGPMLITGLARLDGRTVGIIADQPLKKGGAADAYGTEKFRIFTRLLNSWGIPLVMLSNSSGFMPGSQQERQRIQAIGAESLDVNILGEIPVVSVVFNQNYGGRLIHSFNRFLRPGIVYLSFEDTVLAVIGARVAFDLLHRKRYEKLIAGGRTVDAEELMNDFLQSYKRKSRGGADGIATGLVDWIVPDISELRENLIKGLELATLRCEKAFG